MHSDLPRSAIVPPKAWPLSVETDLARPHRTGRPLEGALPQMVHSSLHLDNEGSSQCCMSTKRE